MSPRVVCPLRPHRTALSRLVLLVGTTVVSCGNAPSSPTSATGGAGAVPAGGCDAGLTQCGTSCVNLQTDPANCGSCGSQCPGGATCSSGACVAATGGSSGSGGVSATGGAGEIGRSGGSSAGTGGELMTGGASGTGGEGPAGGGSGGSSAGTGGELITAGASGSGGAGVTGGSGGSTAGTGGETITGGASGTGGEGPAGGGSGGGTNTGGSATGGSNSCDDPCPFEAGIEWDCKKRFMYGVNYAWKNYAGDFGGISAWEQYGVSANSSAVSNDLADMATHGVSVVRWWIWPDFRGDGVNFSGSNATGLGGTITQDLSRALELAAQHDLYLMLTLFSFGGFTDDYPPNLHDVATNATARAALVDNAVRPLARAVASSPNAGRMIAWDVINEPELAMTGTNGYGDPAYTPQSHLDPLTQVEAETFVSEVIAGLRAESDALITIGATATVWQHAWVNVDLDFYQFHIYDWQNAAETDAETLTKAQSYLYDVPMSDFEVNDKPIVMGECPLAGIQGASYADMVGAWYSNGFAGALCWSVTDQDFGWSSNKSSVQAFADQHPCETQY